MPCSNAVGMRHSAHCDANFWSSFSLTLESGGDPQQPAPEFLCHNAVQSLSSSASKRIVEQVAANLQMLSILSHKFKTTKTDPSGISLNMVFSCGLDSSKVCIAFGIT